MFLTFSAIKERLEDGGQMSVSNGTVKSYSETIVITPEGPSRDCVYGSTVEWFGESNFKETVVCETRMVPYLYCTTLVVPGPPPPSTPLDDSPADDNALVVAAVTTNGFQDDDEEGVDDAAAQAFLNDSKNRIMYHEIIGLKPKWVPVRYSEGTYTFPKETKTTYVTTFTYDPNATQCKFIVGVEMWATVNVTDLGPLSKVTVGDAEVDDDDNDESRDLAATSSPIKTEFGLNTVCQPVVLDFNCNVYNSTKEIPSNGIKTEPDFL